MPSDARLGVTLGVLATILLGLLYSANPDNQRARQFQQAVRTLLVDRLHDYLQNWPIAPATNDQ